MGKEGELWDDSALIKAFDHAISKYKIMHGTCGEKGIKENIPSAEAELGNNELYSSEVHMQNEDDPCTAQESPTNMGDSTEILQSNEELGSSSKRVGTSDIEISNVRPTNGIPAAILGSPEKHTNSSDINSQNEAKLCSNCPEEYSKLLNKYYEVEGQRQQILQQLNQYSNSDYQFPISSTPTAEEYQAPVMQAYDTVSCHCSYGCQNWVVPCNALPASCPGGSCVDKCQAISNGIQNENSISPEDPDFVKMAMTAAERAVALTKEANGGEDKQLGIKTGHFAESKSATDLDVVLNAWYSAGFYTGKYLSEQSMEKRKQGQGL